EIDEFLIVVDPGDLNPAMTLRWQSLIRRTRRLDDPVMTPWHAFAALSKESFAEEARELSTRFANEPAVSAGAPLSVPRVNRLLARAFAESPPKSLDEVATIYARLFKETDAMWENVLNVSQEAGEPAPSVLENPAREQLRRMLYGPDAPANLPLPDIGFNLVLFLPDREGQEAAKKLLNAVEQWVIKGKDLVPRAMVVRDNDRPHDPRVFHRGNPAQPREAVPRQFLSAVAGEKRRPFSKGSGRLELAQAIVDPSNPLTARVIVNRVWMHHFGKSLVRTPSDFGLRSERPVQAELLDHLATRFVQEDDWSIKRLHRRILLSSTYRQSSGHRAECYAIDAENNLLWKQNVRRRDFEGVRDSLLAAAGCLDGKIGGSPSDLLARPFSKRRTIYGLVDRGSLPSLFSAFDFPNPDATSVGRPETTVPQQTLFMMNHHFVVECAKDLLARARRGGKSVDEDTIRALYRTVFARDPHGDELADAKKFLKPVPKAKEDFSDWSYGTAEIEVESGARPARFTELPFWRAGAWHESANAKPEAASGDEASLRGEVHLGVEGGHAGPITGPGSGRVVVRRWTAPVNGRVMIRGSLNHSAERETVKEGGKEIQKKKADGVRARLISSRDGELGRWEVHGEDAVTESKMTEVVRGDTLDFVVDGRANGSDDSFQWTVEIYPVDSRGKRSRLPRWDSRADFRGPQADVWVQFAQALLMTNEFIFVD
ncbi:MAG: DUF1553 domain-containing protein, partial [Planctomycetes bacterium]|nr:DUF1553 domain-containing protein [Planctomycetota bacterium]